MSSSSAGAPLTVALERLRARFARILNGLVPSGPVALLDFPNHPNVGDSAIWLGERAWLATRPDCPVVYVSDRQTFDIDALRRAMPIGTVLLHGGGNFGDLWPDCQALRERYLRELPQYRIVQFPQSIWFRDAHSLNRAAGVARLHPDFTLLVRSDASYDIARRELGLRKVELAPDAAFLLGALHSRKAVQEIVLLARTDHESRFKLQVDGLPSVDWMVDTWPLSLARTAQVTKWCFGRGDWRGRTFSPRWADFIARQRVARGLSTIARGRALVTDRLHACLFGVLLGRHVVALDNNYGKLKSVMDTWLPGYPGITWIDDPADLVAALSRESVWPHAAGEPRHASLPRS